MSTKLQKIYLKLSQPITIRNFVDLIGDMHQILLNQCLSQFVENYELQAQSNLAADLRDEQEKLDELIRELPIQEGVANSNPAKVQIATSDEVTRQDFNELCQTIPKSQEDCVMIIARLYATFRRFVDMNVPRIKSESFRQNLILLSRYFCDQTRKVLAMRYALARNEKTAALAS